jgi:hypothetical protein
MLVSDAFEGNKAMRKSNLILLFYVKQWEEQGIFMI